MFSLAGLCALLFFGPAGVASAVTLTEMIGDKDCFGLGGVCLDGDHYVSDLGGTYFTDNRDIGEVLGVDEWDLSSGLGGPTFTFGLDLGGLTPVSASIELLTAGIDLGSGADFLFNGTSIGSYVEPFGQGNRAKTLTFPVPPALLSNPDSLVLTLSNSGDGFIIDYVELSVLVVPEPSTLAIAGLALLGLVCPRQKRG
ncbi:MAG: PEP-CTERM sorting domain-containing protein [Planctomycetales bacterium]|nr:PEP-CTERM sorting domain-containing protein [Planctomycetales bacterium]